MHKIAQQLIKIAQEYRASEQDARFSQRYAKVIIANYGYDDLKKFIVKQNQQLLQPIKKYGIQRLKRSGYVIHHIGESSHFIETGRKYSEYKEMLSILKDENLNNELAKNFTNVPLITKATDINNLSRLELLKALLDEINHIILLPAWYHNYLHQNNISYNNAAQYYTEMENLVKKYYQNRQDQNHNVIKELQFNGQSIKSALNSIYNLATVANNQNKSEIIKQLTAVYQKIYKKIIKQL